MTGLARLRHDVETQLVSVATDERGFIALTSGLETPVFLSLFTDRRARPSDRVEHPRGWWGDAHARVPGDQIGSLLWLLERSPLTTSALRRAQLYAAEALRWLKTDGLAKEIAVTVEARDNDVAWITVAIVRPDGTTWSGVWDQHGTEVG